MSLMDLFANDECQDEVDKNTVNEEDELERDLEDYIDDSFETSENNKSIISDEYANYLIFRYKSNIEKQEAYRKKAQAIVEDYRTKVEAWAEKRISAYDFDNERCMSLLTEYHKQNAKKDSEKIKLPEGTIGFYKKATSVKIDNSALAAYFDKLDDSEEKNRLSGYLKPKTVFDTTALKKACVVDESNGCLNFDGKPLPGTTVIPAMVEFKVRK